MATWRRTVLGNPESFLAWLNENGAIERQVHSTAERLESFWFHEFNRLMMLVSFGMPFHLFEPRVMTLQLFRDSLQSR